MVAASRTEQAPRPGAFMGEDAEMPATYRKAAARGSKLIEASFPQPRSPYQLRRRIAGLGSLGHPRILALSSWQGAFVAPRSQRDAHIGLGLVPWHFVRRGLRRETG